MRYISTRGEAPELGFTDMVLTGLAPDGGLYVPAAWPALDPGTIAKMAAQSYPEAAFTVMRPFMGGDVDDAVLHEMLVRAYSRFAHPAVAPLCQLAPNDWMLELFHGPTFAFKDFALQFIGELLGWALKKTGKRVTILGATSGDTGSAAIEAVRGRENIRLFMLHPEGRISDIQRKQMTTVLGPNIVNIAVKGTFDDCQHLVKTAFADRAFRERQGLTAVNSINWARIMAQTVYYFYAGSRLGAPYRSVAFAVPTGNFGNVYAGHAANRMGLPVERLVVATNANDILARVLETGEYRAGAVTQTISPAMDIQAASNFERFLFGLHGGDSGRTRTSMSGLAGTGGFTLDAASLSAARARMSGVRIGEDETLSAIRVLYERTGRLIDPHTAVGVAAAARMRDAIASPLVTLSTAHPAKFPDAVARAAGRAPEAPGPLSRLAGLPEQCATIANDAGMLKALIDGTTW